MSRDVTGDTHAARVTAARSSDGPEVLRWNPDEPIEPESHMRLSKKREETNVSKTSIKASVLAAVNTELAVTDEELRIAARIGITEAELLNQKAMDRLQPEELLLMRSGLTPIEILAARIIR